MTSDPPILSHSRTDLLSIAVWWGLLAGFGEGVYQIFAESSIWRDLTRAAVIVEPVLFGAVALLILALRRSRPITRELLVRATLGFSFLARRLRCASSPGDQSAFLFYYFVGAGGNLRRVFLLA